jgi:DsbC/DsbD-like thiol-disulfide interchange protein
MRTFALLLLSAIATTPANAAASAWQELEPGTRVRLIASDSLRPDGTTMIGLELDMPASTKTYWRVPGESGIPAEFELTGSHGVSAHRVLWPYPQIEAFGGFTDFVYYGPTVLPLELVVDGDAPLLRVAVTLGVCSDICMPVVASFELPLDFAAPDHGQDLRIAQAVALAPIEWTEARQPVGDVRFDAVEPRGRPALADRRYRSRRSAFRRAAKKPRWNASSAAPAGG